MRFSNPAKTSPPAIAYAKNLEIAYMLCGRIHRREQEGKIFRALLDYSRVLKLLDDKDRVDIVFDRQLRNNVYVGWKAPISSLDMERAQRLKADAAWDLNNGLVEDRVAGVRKVQKFAKKIGLRFVANRLQPLVDAYSDVKQTDWALREAKKALQTV